MKSHAPTSAEREAFEADIAADGYLLDVHLDWDDKNERYGSSRTNPMFSGWLLARRRAAMQTAEPVLIGFDLASGPDVGSEQVWPERGGEVAPNAYDHLREQYESIFSGPGSMASWRRKQTISGDVADEYVEMRVQFGWMAFQAAHRIGIRTAPDRAPSIAPIKDHITREVVNSLRDVAIEFHAAGQLRSRIQEAIAPLLGAPSIDTAPSLPATPEAVIAMIGSHYAAQRTHTNEGAKLAPEDVEYTLTVHDLLSAFGGGDGSIDSTASWDACRAIAAKILPTDAERDAMLRDRFEAIDAARWRYLEDHASAIGGGKGFTITCHVPFDCEDMGCGVDLAIAALQPEEK
jgi:hypothetical protein